MVRRPESRVLLLIGTRTAAVAAAARLGCRVILASRGAPRRAVATSVHRFIPFDEATEPTDRLAELVGSERIDFVVATTENAVIPAADLRSAWGLPGATPITARLCRDKLAMKRAVRARGVACADFELTDAETSPEALCERLGLPLVVKRRRGSGSRGLRIVRTAEELPAMIPAGRIAERWVDGVEMSCDAIVANRRCVFSNYTEYVERGWANLVPRTLSDAEHDDVHRMLDTVIDEFEIERGFVHLEVFLTPAGPIFGEIALRPPGGELLRLIRECYDFDPWQAWIEAEVGEVPACPTEARGFAAVRFFHAGTGIVRAVCGWSQAAGLDGIVEARCKVRPGTEVTKRLGTGQSSGLIIARGVTRQATLDALARASECVRIVLDESGPSA